MDIFFRTKQLQKVCSVEREMQRELGVQCAKKLRQRMMELRAATVLGDVSHLPPPRLHEYSGAEKGRFSVDLQHPFRLQFIPADDPVSLKTDGGIDLGAVRSIEIIAITDPH
jgi:proteic killer suppression protein